VFYTGLYRQYGIDMEEIPKLEYNRRFTDAKGQFFTSESPFPFFDCELDAPQMTGSYRTVYGPSFYHTAIEYRLSIHNFNCGIHRILRVRESDEIEQECRENQREFVKTKIVADLVDYYTHIITVAFDGIDFEKLYNDNVVVTHPKRLLKMAAQETILSTGNADGLLTQCYKPEKLVRVLLKMKPFEYAKLNKIPRVVMDLGTDGSLLAGHVVPLIKNVLCENDYVIGNLRVTIVTQPSYDALLTAFERLINPDFEFEFVLFSDDSCIVINKAGEIYHANVDIKSCDSSHTSEVFNLLHKMCSGNIILSIAISKAIRQCQIPLLVCPPRKYKVPREGVTLFPIEPTLYSGSGLTSLINKLSNILIALSISQCGDVKRGARNAGYLVTCVVATNISKLQFLKYSPFRFDDGRIGIFLNLGVILRTIGACRGDLPGRGDLVGRASVYNSSLVSAFKHAGDSVILRAIGGRYITTSERVVVEEPRSLLFMEKSNVVPDHAIYDRYDTDFCEVTELVNAINSSGFGDTVYTTLVDKIMKEDYEYL
jgi:hypothetical protein